MSKSTKTSIYILTEGHTEQAYFSRIGEILGGENEWKYSVTVEVREIIRGSKTDPVNMVKEAKKIKKQYDEVWVVFDKDRDRDVENSQAIEIANASKINLGFSSISFEHWVLLHFEKSNYSFYRSDCESRGGECTCNGLTCVSTYLKSNYFPTYIKGKAKLFDDLSDKVNIAFENCAWLKHIHSPIANFSLLNPFSDVDVLVSKLLDMPIVFYTNRTTPFAFDGIRMQIVDYSVNGNLHFVRIAAENVSAHPFIFNNVQTNIKMFDINNQEFRYTIINSVIVFSGNNGTADIQFDTTGSSQIQYLKFQSTSNSIVIEI